MYHEGGPSYYTMSEYSIFRIATCSRPHHRRSHQHGLAGHQPRPRVHQECQRLRSQPQHHISGATEKGHDGLREEETFNQGGRINEALTSGDTPIEKGPAHKLNEAHIYDNSLGEIFLCTSCAFFHATSRLCTLSCTWAFIEIKRKFSAHFVCAFAHFQITSS